jgi:hypothetical protein
VLLKPHEYSFLIKKQCQIISYQSVKQATTPRLRLQYPSSNAVNFQCECDSSTNSETSPRALLLLRPTRHIVSPIGHVPAMKPAEEQQGADSAPLQFTDNKKGKFVPVLSFFNLHSGGRKQGPLDTAAT